QPRVPPPPGGKAMGQPEELREVAAVASVPQGTLPEQVIAFSIMSACFLIPTAWILAHVEHYKRGSG
uniref:Uncharacterized protein n=1 Tax=Accipiter nisus TaxID=211598 RepID=A0A8B9N5Z7_9AVES